MSKSVFALATSDIHADTMIQALTADGFLLDDISLIIPTASIAGTSADGAHATVVDSVATAGAAGGIIGGALGWVARMGLMAIPGFGPMIAAGPIVAALSGAAIGGTLGNLGGSLIGMGMHGSEAKRYEGLVRGGRILISVQTRTSDRIVSARKIFADIGALDIGYSTEVSAKSAIPLSESALRAKLAETRIDAPA